MILVDGSADILLCRFTDPSWAPLSILASALVIDIGGAASRGAVVAREMGIPFVIGSQAGASTIQDGWTERSDRSEPREHPRTTRFRPGLSPQRLG